MWKISGEEKLQINYQKQLKLLSETQELQELENVKNQSGITSNDECSERETNSFSGPIEDSLIV